MQVTTTIAHHAAPTTPPASPRHIGTADGQQGAIDIYAGAVLRSNVTDIDTTAREMWREYFARPLRHAHMATVGFIRNGDAWDAVELLTRDSQGAFQQAWMPSNLRPDAGVTMDAVWLLADYGGDYSRIILAGDR